MRSKTVRGIYNQRVRVRRYGYAGCVVLSIRGSGSLRSEPLRAIDALELGEAIVQMAQEQMAEEKKK